MGGCELADLRDENQRLQSELQCIRKRLDAQHNPTAHRLYEMNARTTEAGVSCGSVDWEGTDHNLTKCQIERYSRQILLGTMGARAQEKLCQASVLVIGAGGLGCPAAIYLAACGVGHLGIVDHDVVEISNLHRQVLHTESSIGTHKAASAAAACKALNSSIQVTAYEEGFFPGNALQVASGFDVLVDATDNVATRYLVNDVCCILGCPLVSGAAIGTEGQLTVYCHQAGPCYRCLFPQAPAPDNCSRCSEAGVLGPAPGVVGVLQALEVIKIVTGVGSVSSQRLLICDFLEGRFTKVKLRSKQAGCISCSNEAAITRDNLHLYQYGDFTGQAFHDRINDEVVINREKRIDAHAFLAVCNQAEVLDVRSEEQYCAFHLQGAIHLPYDERSPQKFAAALNEYLREEGCPLRSQRPIIVLCRRGNDSQRVVEMLGANFGIQAQDLEGGLLSLAQHQDTLPNV